MAAGVLSGFSLVVGDACARAGWPYFDATEHVTASLGLYAAVGALLGLLAAGLILLERWLVGRRVAGRGPAWLLLRPAFYGLVGGAASSSTALWTFSGEQVQKTALATLGPLVFMAAAGCASALGAFVLAWLSSAIARRSRLWLLGAAAFWGLGVLVARIDLTVYVSLYSRVHTILELVAALCFGAAYALGFERMRYVPKLRRVRSGLGLAAAAWLSATLLVPNVRTWFDQSLKHVWLEEVYIGRMLRRIQVAEAFLADPFSWQGMRMARIETLKKRYRLHDLSLDSVWQAPLAEPAAQWDALRRLRGGQNRHNVIVFYVDTLRADAAREEKTMPNYARFRERALDFQRAYAVGSDTLRSLPAMTGGNYDVLETPENDILRVAKRANYDSSLVIAKSAFEFLGKLRPEFHFDHAEPVEDYPAEQQVWGYGAQQPTAPRLVDRALEFIDKPRKQPFFLWLFNFDQHNWRELEGDYVDEAAKRFALNEADSPLPYRYRVVARSIDEQFGRLLAGLEQRKLMEDTVILFVSDHGEALGRDGFWVHSVFLWESLIRVPLTLYAPRLGPKSVERKVSLVDVAPTLGRYMDPTLDGRGYHGEDLLSTALPNAPARRFPLLLVAASKDTLVRVGLVDPVEEYKLVLSFEAALPELYDLTAADPDAKNHASERADRVRRGLSLLLRSPLFPRVSDDFDVRDTRAQRALAGAVESPAN